MIHLVLAVALATASPEPPRAQQANPGEPEGRRQAREDLAKLQGVWSCVLSESRGRRTISSGPAYTAEYRGDRLILRVEGQLYRTSIITLDPTQTPKAMNTWHSDGPKEDQTRPGIYEIDGDTLKICLAEPGEARPKTFSTTEGTGRFCFVYERVKP